MTFQIKTPALASAMDAFQVAIDRTKVGSIEAVAAKNLVQAGNGVVKMVGQELKVRLAGSKLAAVEAEMIARDQAAEMIAMDLAASAVR